MSNDSEAKRVAIPFLDRMHASIKRDACMFEEKIRQKAAPVVSAIRILEKEARCAKRAITTLRDLLATQRRDIYPDNDVRSVLAELAREHVAIIPAWEIDEGDDVHITMFLALISDVDYQREAKMRIDVFNAMLRIDGGCHGHTHTPQFVVQRTRMNFGNSMKKAAASGHTVAVDAMSRAQQQGQISPMFDTTAFLRRAWDDDEITAVKWVDDFCQFTAEIRVCLLVAVNTDHSR